MIGKKIKELRIALGYSQEELANKVFITQHALSQYENGKRKIPDETLTLLAESLGVDISVKLNKKEEFKRKPDDFYKKKRLNEFEVLSPEELTEYVMRILDQHELCSIAGNLPFTDFRHLDYHEQYEDVLNAIEQFPWEDFVYYLKDVCLEDEREFQEYVDSL